MTGINPLSRYTLPLERDVGRVQLPAGALNGMHSLPQKGCGKWDDCRR